MLFSCFRSTRIRERRRTKCGHVLDRVVRLGFGHCAARFPLKNFMKQFRFFLEIYRVTQNQIIIECVGR